MKTSGIFVSIRNDEIPKKLKYLVMVFEKGKYSNKIGRGRNEVYMSEDKPHRYLGFLSTEPQQTISTFLTGKEKGWKKYPHGTIVQLPKVFDTIKQAKERIKQHRRMHKAFKENSNYEIIPIEVGN